MASSPTTNPSAPSSSRSSIAPPGSSGVSAAPPAPSATPPSRGPDEDRETLEAMKRVSEEMRDLMRPVDEYGDESPAPPADAAPHQPAKTPGVRRTPTTLADARTLLTLSRYEQRLDSQLKHIIQEIENCKTRRHRANNPPLYAI
jgi:hypothetical protein